MAVGTDEVFWITGDERRPLRLRPFREGILGTTLEDALQRLLEKHADVIPGSQMEPGSEDPPRFVLLRREMPVAGWSLDHLLVDQRGVLTLVEAKLIQNPESRREVLGQVFEYAAFAQGAWGNGRVRQIAESGSVSKGGGIDRVLQEKFGPNFDTEAFWTNVDKNLAEGRIRLIIAADELRPEVRRVIEYLNLNMPTVEIYGLELRCYGDAEQFVLVPLLVGRSQIAEDARKGVPQPWDPQRFFDDLTQKSGQDVPVARRLLEAWKEAGLSMKWGEGEKWGSLHLIADPPDVSLVSVWTNGSAQLNFGGISAKDGRSVIHTKSPFLPDSLQWHRACFPLDPRTPRARPSAARGRKSVTRSPCARCGATSQRRS